MSAETTADAWAQRATVAETAVNTRFGRRLFGLPGTWLAKISTAPAKKTEWHYWWQAHYLDCLVDAAWRRSQHREPVDLGLARALLRGIRLRNFLILVNSFYDDMAWLALAVGRGQTLSEQTLGRAFPGARSARRVLGRQLRKAFTDDLGGGLFWSKKRDFKNTPVNGPAALYFARDGEAEQAQRILDWLDGNLWDAEKQLYIDGIHLRPTGPEREETVWTYNQGPVLGAFCALPSALNLARAVQLIDGVERGLSRGEHGGAVLLHGEGDSGLFTGILIRYLGVAARNPQLPDGTREAARRMVFGTAEAVWATRSADGVFSKELGLSAEQAYPPGTAVGLSTQLQAWMILETAHQLASA